jgi:hypothetical protein
MDVILRERLPRAKGLKYREKDSSLRMTLLGNEERPRAAPLEGNPARILNHFGMKHAGQWLGGLPVKSLVI